MKEDNIEEEIFGISLGRYKAEICDNCFESFVDENTMLEIEKKARELGIWGLAKKIKVVRVGNSLAVRLPTDIVKFMKLHEGKEIFLHPEGTTKITLEII
ncbi:MAG: hypothetical protein ACE5KT_03830 [Methanosarcinales archaeon]